MSDRAASLPQMIDWNQLIAPVPPWGHLLVCTERDIDTAISRFRNHGPRRNRVAICVTRGDHSRTRMDLFNEWTDALRLQWNVRNWAAFHEVIIDMSWMPAKSYVYVVKNADQLLIGNGRALRTLIDLCASSADWWASYGERDPPHNGIVLFHVLFQCDPAVAEATRQRLEEAGARLEEVVLLYDSDELEESLSGRF